MHASGTERYWMLEADELFRRVDSTSDGLSSAEARERLERFGRNELLEEARLSRLRVVWSQVRSPLLLILLFAAVVSALTREWSDAAIVIAIVLATVGIGYMREYGAQAAVAALRARVKTRASVVRDGETCLVPLEEIVPGDVVLLGFAPIPVTLLGVLVAITILYVSGAELMKKWFYRSASTTGRASF
jgi:Mg2+-importing ATPase